MRISGTSKNLLRNLPEKATIELFVSNDLPDEAVLVARKARDFVQEYVNSSRGKVKLIILDPDNDKSAQATRALTCACSSSICASRSSKKGTGAEYLFRPGAVLWRQSPRRVNNLIGLYEQHDLENQLTAKTLQDGKTQ
jgi:hypothetical protein